MSKIVQTASTYDQKVIDESIEKLSKKSANLKGELHELVKQQYVDFDSYVATTVTLEQRVQEVRSEYQRIATRIEQDLSGRIAQSHDKRDEIESKLKVTVSRVALVQHLVDIYQAVESSRLELQSGKYVAAAERLSNAAESLAQISQKGCEAQVFLALKSEHILVISALTFQLQEEWHKFFSWSPKAIPNEPSFDLLSRIELHVPVRLPSIDERKTQVIRAMKLLSSTGLWEQRVKLFSQKLLQCVMRPLIVHSSLKASHSHNKGERIISLRKLPDTEDTTIAQLYEMLVGVLTVIGHVVTKDYEKEWLRMVGETLCPDIEELVISHRLSTSIPRNLSELDAYGAIRAKTREFEENVVEMGMCKDGQMCKMSEYADNVNVHFMNQKSQDMLVKARSILMQPMHTTVTVSEVDPFAKLEEFLPLPDSSMTDQEPEGRSGFDIASLSFAFPSCAVSQSVQEFINHLYQTLRECCNSTNPSAAVQLFHLARSMVDLFCAVLSSHHSAAIAELPRVAAVQHNNCMYLAHHLVTLGHQFHSRLPPPLNTQTTTFVDQVPIVRSLGEECFLAEMRKQSSCLVEYLKSFGAFDEISGDSRRETVRQSVQRALHHVTKLSRVYLEVLPIGIHHKAIGDLLNVLVSEIIRVVLSTEDIAAGSATELHSLLNVVVENAPPTLMLTAEETSRESIASYCKNWEKLKALAVVLDDSLLEIVELWDSGNGRLAKEFSVSELRGLIKALFRNTEHRAAALNKITISP